MLTVDNFMDEFSERQIEIIRATIHLIADEGVHNFSIRKLAARVGVTEPAIYRHFESKDDLMIKLAIHIVRNWHELLGELAVQQLPSIERMRVIFSEVMNYLDGNREFAKTLLSTDLFATDSGMTKVLVDLKDDGAARLSEFISEAQACGDVRGDVDSTSVTRILFGSIWWAATDWIARGFTGSLPDDWDRMWQDLVKLLEK